LQAGDTRISFVSREESDSASVFVRGVAALQKGDSEKEREVNAMLAQSNRCPRFGKFPAPVSLFVSTT
jgi:hypothetical protein